LRLKKKANTGPFHYVVSYGGDDVINDGESEEEEIRLLKAHLTEEADPNILRGLKATHDRLRRMNQKRESGKVEIHVHHGKVLTVIAPDIEKV
jgi:hypothetical protein